MTADAVNISGLSVNYGAIPVLEDITLNIPRGTLSAIIGPNGAGKSTLLKSVLGLLPTKTGNVSFPLIRSKKEIAYVPQRESIDWTFPTTVLDVVLMGRYGHLGWFRRPKKQDRECSLETLKKLGMEQYAERPINKLSGGQQQRVFLARALVQKAEIYFMDEPFKGVDNTTEQTLIALLKELKDMGKTVIVVHHDLQTVTKYFDRVTLINRKIIASGKVEDVFCEHNLCKTFCCASVLKSEVV